LSVSSPVSDR